MRLVPFLSCLAGLTKAYGGQGEGDTYRVQNLQRWGLLIPTDRHDSVDACNSAAQQLKSISNAWGGDCFPTVPACRVQLCGEYGMYADLKSETGSKALSTHPSAMPPSCPLCCTALPLLRLWLTLLGPRADIMPMSPSARGGSMAARARKVMPSAVKMLSYGALQNVEPRGVST